MAEAWRLDSDHRPGPDWASVHLRTFTSLRCGLRVVQAHLPGPLVQAYFGLATEAHDDDGLPHALEHLVHLGSQKWPFSGTLDRLALRCLSSGPNAWTDTDHTCYTLATVGVSGWSQLLATYLDHILFPTLTESAFLTEVFHIDGQALAGGVLYCEMSGREYSAPARVQLALLRALYPGHCGYKSQTGGLLTNLRQNITRRRVQRYHREFYRPDNLVLIMIGSISDALLFPALAPVVDRIERRWAGQPPMCPRPWSGLVPEFVCSTQATTTFPSDDERDGLVYLGWRGPSGTTNLYTLYATVILMEYLTASPLGPLVAALVESDEPIAGEVNYQLVENSDCAVFLSFENVPLSVIDQVESKVHLVFDQVLQAGVDMPCMDAIIRRRILRHQSDMETNPHDTIASLAISDFLYGYGSVQLQDRFLIRLDHERLQNEPAHFWRELLLQIRHKPKAFVQGLPSCSLRAELARADEEGRRRRAAELGDAGLRIRAQRLEQAIEENSRVPSKEALDNFFPMSVADISLHEIQSWNLKWNVSKAFRRQRGNSAGLNHYLIHGKTNFVYMRALLDTRGLSKDIRQLLQLYCELLLKSPMVVEGQTYPFEKVIGKINEDTVNVRCSLGCGGQRFQSGSHSRFVVIEMQVEPRKIESALIWLRRLIQDAQFTTDQVEDVATRMENSISDFKREGEFLAQNLLTSLSMDTESNAALSTILHQRSALKSVRKTVSRQGSSHSPKTTSCEATDPLNLAKSKCSQVLPVLDSLERIQAHLSHNIALFMAADWDRVRIPWDLVAQVDPKHSPDVKFTSDSTERMNESAHLILGIGSIDSSYLIRNVASLTDCRHLDYPALMVYIQYLSQPEGPLWRKLRGQGLVYGFSLSLNTGTGYLQLALLNAGNLWGAYRGASEVISKSLLPDYEYSEANLVAARNGLTFHLLEKEASIGATISEEIARILQELETFHPRRLAEDIMTVESDDLKRVSQLYASPLLSHEQTRTVILTHSKQVKLIQGSFESHEKVKFQIATSISEASRRVLNI